MLFLLRGVAMSSRIVNLGAGDYLFEENDAGDGVYIVREGLIEVGKKRNGDFISLAKMTSGDVIGTMSLFTHEPRSAASRAVKSSVVVHIDNAAIESSFSNLPVWVQAVLKDCVARLKHTSEELVDLKLREKQVSAKLGGPFQVASQLASLLAYAIRTGTIEDEGITLFPLKGFFERSESVLLKRSEYLESLFQAFMKGSLLKAQDDKKWGRAVFAPNAQLLDDFSVFSLQVAKKNDFNNFVPLKHLPVLSALVRISRKEKEPANCEAAELIRKIKAECGKVIDASTVQELVRLRILSQVPASEQYSWVERQIQRRIVFESTCRFVKDAQSHDSEQKVA